MSEQTSAFAFLDTTVFEALVASSPPALRLSVLSFALLNRNVLRLPKVHQSTPITSRALLPFHGIRYMRNSLQKHHVNPNLHFIKGSGAGVLDQLVIRG